MRAEPVTLLSIFDYAKILGLDPLHFAGGYSAIRPAPACRDVWFQYDWQNADLVSRHQVASLIAEAERDIADALGYWPAPVWIEDEHQPYTRLYRRDLTGYGQNLRFRGRSTRVKWGYAIEGGVRAAEPIAVVRYTTLDNDNDGFEETAVFVLDGVSEDLDPCEIHAFYKNYDYADIENTRIDPASVGADPAWEIRPIRVIRKDEDTIAVYCYVWQLFSPTLYEMLGPVVDGTCQPIDADDIDSYVNEVAFYRVYNAQYPQVQFLWRPGDPCAEPYQDGHLYIDDTRNGLVFPLPATYNADTDTYTEACGWINGYEPDRMRLWYRAGYTETGMPCSDTLSPYWALTIAMLATARSDWPICTCNNVNNALLAPELREDMRRMTSDRSFIADARTLGNPFGSRVGEVEAWIRVSKARGRAKGQAVLS